jgi:hypothetical protein
MSFSSLLSCTVGMKDGSRISGLPVPGCSFREAGVFLLIVNIFKNYCFFETFIVLLRYKNYGNIKEGIV